MYRELAFALFALLSMVLVMEAIRETKYEKTLGLFLILLYFASLVYITTLKGARTELGGFNFKFPPPFLRAIISRKYSTVTNRSVLNMLLFVPLGVLFPYNISLWREKTGEGNLRLKTVMFIGLLVSLTIEICQMVFRVGVFEIDDLVKNTLGTGIGYMIFRILCKNHYDNSD